jgi:glycosyltransferase involved in cell wall biosynthesis
MTATEQAARSSLPLVSIVTPSLNQGRFLEQAIRSVLEQDYPSIEHIVVDGGSTDETVAVLGRHPHLRWVSESDRGQANAINKGFRMASGDVLGWLNADDYYLPGAISAAVGELVASGCALVHGGWRQVDEEGRTIKDVAAVPFDYSRQLEERNAVAQPGSLFTRVAFDAVGGLDETLDYALDYELWLKLGSRFEVRHVDRVLAAYRYHPSSKSVSEYQRFAAETWRASRRHGARLRSPLFVHFYLPYTHPRLYRLARRAAAIVSGLPRLVVGLRRMLDGRPA